ncbi:MAG: hypothetical protein HZA51_09005 [Planctomycetes bacterium]|nr:hypothetical protein [Planctomycetota bacterium]
MKDSAALLSISKDVDYDIYEVDYGNGSAARVLRFPFRLDWFEGLSVAMIGGIFSGTLAVVIKKAMTKRYAMQQHKKCLHCGYNLNGNVSGICPECGKPVQSSLP